MLEQNYDVLHEKGHVPIKTWTKNVPFEDGAKQQLLNTARLPFIHRWVAAMPDVHWGMGATIGSVIPTTGAIIPAAVGVDIGCGMMAVQTDLMAKDLPDNLHALRLSIESAVPHGRTNHGGHNDRGAWANPPDDVLVAWKILQNDFKQLCDKTPSLEKTNNLRHLGTLGTGNHFIEICLDENQQVWFMLHSGSRGVGNQIGNFYIKQAKKEMQRWFIQLPDENLAYLAQGSQYFNDYVDAVDWAQRFAYLNREIMMQRVINSVKKALNREFNAQVQAVNCHHNYVAKEHHYNKNVWITRKGAVRARTGDLGIIPGSMGAKSYIVRGLGNEESFCSCSHGAGRTMSRNQAKREISLEEHRLAVEGVECRLDNDVIDETPAAYKPIDLVMEAQKDLVEIVHTLKQVVCVKG